jgi:hypothetical protein
MKKFIGLIIILFLVLANSPMVLAVSNKATNKNTKSIPIVQKQKTTITKTVKTINKENPAKTVKTTKVVKSTQTPTPVSIPTPTFTRTPTPVVYRQPSLPVTSVSLPVGSAYVTKNYPTSISNSAKESIHPTTTSLQAVPRLTPTSPFRPVRAVVPTPISVSDSYQPAGNYMFYQPTANYMFTVCADATSQIDCVKVIRAAMATPLPTPTSTLPLCTDRQCVQERIRPLCFPDGKALDDPDLTNALSYPTAKQLLESGHGNRLGLFTLYTNNGVAYACFTLVEGDKVWYIDLEGNPVHEPYNP